MKYQNILDIMMTFRWNLILPSHLCGPLCQIYNRDNFGPPFGFSLRDAPIFQFCSFFNIVQRGRGGQTRVRKKPAELVNWGIPNSNMFRPQPQPRHILYFFLHLKCTRLLSPICCKSIL